MDLIQISKERQHFLTHEIITARDFSIDETSQQFMEISQKYATNNPVFTTIRILSRKSR